MSSSREPGAVRKVAQDVVGHRQRQTRLPHTSGTDEGHQAARSEMRGNRATFPYRILLRA